MVSQTARYALHILGFLAGRSGEMVSGDEIAATTGIPANYLSKILNQLRKAGMVESRKGWGGGFRLEPAAAARPIRDVLAAIDGVASTERSDCVFGLPECDPDHPCPLHGYWEQIRSTFDEMLSTNMVGDLAASGKETP
jgi:Rrf2 family iron-sulfur cluster assembly transcriptional regulator